MRFLPIRLCRAGVCALVALLAGRGHAADAGFFEPEAGRLVLRSFSPTEFQAQPQSWTMVQREDGVRVFGFYGGVAEFDGTAWKTLHSALGSFRNFAQAADGRVYFSATGDVGWIDHAPDGSLRLESILAAFPAEALPAGAFAEFAVVGGKLHVSTTRGVVRWDGRKVDRFWPLPGTRTARLSRVGDRLWFRRMGATEVLELRGDEWVKVVDDSSLTGRGVQFVVAAGDGAPVVGVEPGGLYRVGPDGRLAPWSTPADGVLARAQLYSAAALNDGTIAVGTFSDGLILIAPDGRQARQVTMRDGLPSSVIQGISTDRSGRVWLGTYNGLATFDWPAAFTVFDQRDELDASMVRSMRRHDGRIVLGGIGGVSAIEPRPADQLAPARIVRFSALESVNSDPVRHASGLVYGGPHGLRTWRDGKPEMLLPLEDNVILVEPAPDNPDRILFAGQKGIGSALYRDGRWQLEGYAAGYSQISVIVRQTRDGLIWVRNAAGDAFRIRVPRLSSGAPDWGRTEVTPFSAIPGWKAQATLEWTMAVTAAGLTAMTPDGVIFYRAEAGRFEPDRRFDHSGRPVGALFTLFDEPAGIWGAVFADGRRPGSRHAMGRFTFDREGAARWEPLPGNLAATLGALAAHDVAPDSAHPGVYWLRGLSSVMRLDLARVPVPRVPGAPMVRSIRSGDQLVALPTGDAAVLLPWTRQALSFQVAAPRSDLGGVQCEMRLVGWNETWSNPTSQLTATYDGLAAGRYVFEVRERDAHGRAGPVTQVAFVIAPPWWETPWARAAYVLAAGIAVVIFLRWRLAAARREQARLERIVQQRTGELAAARDEAEAASRAKSTFLAHMSHELRTPLNGIIGYAQVLLKDAAVAGRQRERVNIVHTSGLHLLRMINEVLDFSKIEAGKIERHDAPFHFGQLLRELAVAHEAAAHARGLAFALETPADLPSHVSGDAQKLRQILDNLLSNAVKFTPQGRVTLQVERAGESRAGSPNPAAANWRFTVADTGVGLDAQDRARLFQPFEQARHGRPAEPGTGLGLAITQRLVQLLGGELELDSEPGRGSRFSFTLALPGMVAPETAARPLPPLTGYAGPRRRILVVDDNAVNRSLLTDLLAPLGFTVAEFASAEEMLAAGPGELRGDLAFLDVKLPGLDGLELARRLRARADSRAMPIVFTSASVLTFDRASAEAIGCPDFLPKPFAEPQLNELLLRLMKLEWQHGAAPDAGARVSSALSRVLLEQLLALADSGDIAALRSALADARRVHASDVTLSQVETAAASYQLEQVRQLLRSALA